MGPPQDRPQVPPQVRPQDQPAGPQIKPTEEPEPEGTADQSPQGSPVQGPPKAPPALKPTYLPPEPPGTRGTASSDVAGRQSKSKDLSGDGFQFQLPFESFRPPPGGAFDCESQAGRLKANPVVDNNINVNINNGNGNALDVNSYDANEYEEQEYYDDDEEEEDNNVTNVNDAFDVTTIRLNIAEVTTEPPDLLTTNSDIVNEEIGPFDDPSKRGNIVFEVKFEF